MNGADCQHRYNSIMQSRMSAYNEGRQKSDGDDFRRAVFMVAQVGLASMKGQAPDLMALFDVSADDLTDFLMARQRR